LIPRYSLPEMAQVWDEPHRLRLLLKVELEFLRAIAGPKRIPARELALFEKRAAEVTPAEVAELEKETRHDVVALLEAAFRPIERRAPSLSRYLHYGLTSSDLLDSALALQAVDAADLLLREWARVKAALGALAKRQRGLPTVGRSHGIHAEPTGFSIKLAGFYAEAGRNEQRLRAAREAIRYGKLSGAVGNFAHTEPAWEARALARLGLKPEPVATQVVPRDRHAEYLCALALSAGAVERLAVELRHLQRTEVAETEEPFGRGQKGSSAMPHKRNPVLSENITGLARLVRAYAGAGLEDIALWHERDISHSSVERVVFPDATIALHFMLRRLGSLLEGLVVHRGRVRENLDRTRGLVYSQKVLLALMDKGLGRLDAYRLVQRNAMKAFEEGRPFGDVLHADPEVAKRLSSDELERCFSPEGYLRWEGELLKRAGVR
jgi:adenylosuccinate lyase